MPSGPAINMGIQIDAARKKRLAGVFSDDRREGGPDRDAVSEGQKGEPASLRR